MALLENSILNSKFDLIEESTLSDNEIINETDSGVFSETTVTPQLPFYFTPHQINSNARERDPDKTHKKYVIRRAINKKGKLNIIRTKIPYLWSAYIRDIGNTLVNSRWRWTLMCFSSSYIFSWLIFSWFYMLIANDNEDLSETDPSLTPCLVGINKFAGYFLFSVETQHTIGYGTRYITSNCPEGTFLICLQMIFGVALCGGMASIVYTKMVRPYNSSSTALFSKSSVICQRDGQLSLIFRVRDEHSRHQVRTAIKAYLVKSRNQDPFLKSIALEPIGFLLWPLEVEHKITSLSPFWDLSAKDLITKSFEILVVMHGTSRTTGQCSLTRTSYLSSEILWGHRFKPCVHFDNQKHAYYANPADFNTTEEVVTPLCSAQRLHEIFQETPNYMLPTSYIVKSPTLSRYGTDEDSFRTSSGIGSIHDEIITAEVYSDNNSSNVILRKLSTITEFHSFENLKAGGSKDTKNSVTLTEIHDCPDSISSNEDNKQDLTENKNKNISESRGIFNIRDLIASLQNYLNTSETFSIKSKDASV